MTGRRKPFVRVQADWVRAIETVHAPFETDAEWAEAIGEVTQPIFPDAVNLLFYVIEHGPDFTESAHITTISKSPPAEVAGMLTAMRALGPDAFEAYHYPRTAVSLQTEIARRMGIRQGKRVAEFAKQFGVGEAIGIVSNPAPGVVSVLAAMSDQPIELHSYERQLLTRLALHIDAGHRARRRPEQIEAELTHDGRILHRASSLSPPTHEATPAAKLETHVARVNEARSRSTRKTGEAVELWSALLAGRASLIPKNRGGYLLINNPPETHESRELKPIEQSVLSLAARGMSTKLIGYALGIASSAVSSHLAHAASKIGVLSRVELLRVAAILARDPRSVLPDVELTGAEKEILDGLQRGLSNREIAHERSRSVRTIANQVAALLRKTGRSRRGLIGSSSR